MHNVMRMIHLEDDSAYKDSFLKDFLRGYSDKKGSMKLVRIQK